MHTTSFFVLLVYYVYNHMLKQSCYKEKNHTNRETRRKQVKCEGMKCWEYYEEQTFERKLDSNNSNVR
jgi:hypothetical protein